MQCVTIKRSIKIVCCRCVKTMWSDEATLQFEDGSFTQFIHSPMCSMSSENHRDGRVKDFLTKAAVKGKVSTLPALTRASTKFQQKKDTSNERVIVSLSFSVRVRKGFLVSNKETKISSDHGMTFTVESIELGIEEILIVTTEIIRQQVTTEYQLKVEVTVPLFEISTKMTSIHPSSSYDGFVVIDHYSSKTGRWEHFEFDGSQYQVALTEVKRIEREMSTIPEKVKYTPYNQLPRIRLVIKPCLQENQNIGLLMEVQNKIESLQLEIAESEALRMNNKTERLKGLLTQLKCLTLKNFAWQDLADIQRNITHIFSTY